MKKLCVLLSATMAPLAAFSATGQSLPVASSPQITPPAVRQVARDESKGIRDMLASVTEAAMRKDGLDDLIERLVEADRARMGSSTVGTRGSKELDAVVQQIRREWKVKYRQEFEINEDLVFGSQFLGLQVVQGLATTPVLLSNAPNQTQEGNTTSAIASGPQRPPATPRLTPPTDVAVIVFPVTPALPELAVSLGHELPDHWRIDVPDSVDAQRLRGGLLQHLQALAQARAQWPADVNDGYRLVAHCVMAALHGAEPRASAK